MSDVRDPLSGSEATRDPPANGVAKPASREPLPLPPEIADWGIQRLTPEELEEERRTFDVDAYLAAVQEVMKTGGVSVEEVQASVRRIIYGDR